MSDLYQVIQQWVSLHGGSDLLAGIAARTTVISLTVVLSLLANFVAKRLIVGGLRRLVAKTRSKWDDLLLRRKVFTRLSHLAPGLVIFFLAEGVLAGHPKWIATVMTATQIYMILVGFAVGNALLSAVVDIYRTLDISRTYPIKGFRSGSKDPHIRSDSDLRAVHPPTEITGGPGRRAWRLDSHPDAAVQGLDSRAGGRRTLVGQPLARQVRIGSNFPPTMQTVKYSM